MHIRLERLLYEQQTHREININAGVCKKGSVVNSRVIFSGPGADCSVVAAQKGKRLIMVLLM